MLLCRIPQKDFTLVPQVGSHTYKRLVQGQSLAVKCLLICFMFYFQAEENPYKPYTPYLVPPSCLFPSPFALGFLTPSPDFLQAWVNIID